MNRQNIRYKIIFWYSLTLLVVTTIIFASFFIVTRQTLYRQVDQELTSHVVKLTDIATRNVQNMHEILLRQDLFKEFSEIPGMLVVILDQNGNVLSSSLQNGPGKETYAGIFSEVKGASTHVFANQAVESANMRFVADPVYDNDTFIGAVMVAHPIDVIQKSLNSLISSLFIIFGVLMIPAILGGYVLAGQIMRPIAAMSDKMERVTSEHLNERVTNPQTGDELEKLAVSFNRLLERLQASFARERQFIGDVAHELKTPVSTLRGEVELTLSKTRSVQEYKEAFAETLTDINRLSTLIKNILDLAWLNADSAVVGQQKVDLSGVVKELLDIAKKLAVQQQIKFTSNVDPNIVVQGSEDKLSRAILNLIDNAIKYTPEGKAVAVTLQKKGELAVLQIVDTGIGIPTQDLPHVFDRFYRGSKAVKTLGSGLGLAISQGIIKAHHGEIQIKSQVAKGTQVTITLPLMSKSS
jgi:heavy metal sensor kinase